MKQDQTVEKDWTEAASHIRSDHVRVQGHIKGREVKYETVRFLWIGSGRVHPQPSVKAKTTRWVLLNHLNLGDLGNYDCGYDCAWMMSQVKIFGLGSPGLVEKVVWPPVRLQQQVQGEVIVS